MNSNNPSDDRELKAEQTVWNRTMEQVQFPGKASLPYRVVYNGNSLMSICSDGDKVVVALPLAIPEGRNTYFQPTDPESRSLQYMVWAANLFPALVGEVQRLRDELAARLPVPPAEQKVTPKCPQCGKELEKVSQSRNSPLNSDQFDAVRAGDWFCECHNNGRGNTEYAYFWDSEVIPKLPVPPAAPSEPVERCSDCPRLYDTEGPICEDCPPLESGKAAPPAPASEPERLADSDPGKPWTWYPPCRWCKGVIHWHKEKWVHVAEFGCLTRLACADGKHHAEPTHPALEGQPEAPPKGECNFPDCDCLPESECPDKPSLTAPSPSLVEAPWKETRYARQQQIYSWCIAAFGHTEATSLPQRGLRLLEEAAEAAQAVSVDLAIAHHLLDVVWSKPPGEIGQELGGVGITTLALAAAAGLSADEEESREATRVLDKPLVYFAKRNQAKNDAGLRTSLPSPQPVEGAALIAAERRRQIESENWTPEHDDSHAKGEMADAAACYAKVAAMNSYPGPVPLDVPSNWPWDAEWWKPSSDPIRNLVKAGALIAAEIDRLNRTKKAGK